VLDRVESGPKPGLVLCPWGAILSQLGGTSQTSDSSRTSSSNATGVRARSINRSSIRVIGAGGIVCPYRRWLAVGARPGLTRLTWHAEMVLGKQRLSSGSVNANKRHLVHRPVKPWLARDQILAGAPVDSNASGRRTSRGLWSGMTGGH